MINTQQYDRLIRRSQNEKEKQELVTEKLVALIYNKNYQRRNARILELYKNKEADKIITLYTEPKFDGDSFQFCPDKVSKIVMTLFGLIELYEGEEEPPFSTAFIIGSISNKKKSTLSLVKL